MRIVSFFKLCEEDISELIKIQKNKAFMKKLPEHFLELEQQLEHIQSSMEELMSENAVLKQEVTRLNKAVESVHSKPNKALDKSIEKVEQKLTSFISNVAANSSDTEKRLIKLETERNSLIKQVDSLVLENKNLNERVSQSEIQIKDLSDDNEKLFEQILLLNTENKSQNERIRTIVRKGTHSSVKSKDAFSGAYLADKKPPSPESKVTAAELTSTIPTLTKPASLEPAHSSKVISPVKTAEFEMMKSNNTILERYNGSKRHVIIPIGIEVIDNKCFFNCKSMESVAIPEGVKYIGERAFESCTNLKEVILPNSTLRVDKFAFADCSNLVSAVMPKNLTDIALDAFNDCPKLTIKCAADSGAEKYAKKTKIPYIIAFHKNCKKCGYRTPLLEKKKCPVCGSKEWKDNYSVI